MRHMNIRHFFAIIICLAILLFSALCTFSCSKKNSFDDPPPTLPDNQPKNYPIVIIDAGHGGEDGGAIGINGVLEKDLNLKIALELDQLLQSAGLKTKLTRSEDILLYDKNSDYQGHKKEQDMAARLSTANEYTDAIFISIHMNSFSQEKYSGLQVYYSENSELSVKLAQTVQDTVVKNLQANNTRKIKPSGDNIYLLKMISHPSILIECGFLSNSDECALLCSDEYQQKLSLVIYSAIMNYFDSLQNNTSNNT